MRHWWLIPVVVVAAAGCKTFFGPFINPRPDYTQLPGDALRQVAQEIETAIQEGNRTPDIPGRGGVVANSDVVKQAIRTRAARSELVSKLRASGHAYEQRGGLIAILPGKEYKKATTKRQRDLDARLVVWENMDRRAIYTGILEAGNFSPKSRTAIQEIFYEVRVEDLPSGQKYEDATGKIVTK